MNGEDTLARHAETAYEAVRAINHLTIFGPPLPAPDLYPVLGALTHLGHALHQVIGQLASGLERSPDYYELYETDPDQTPTESIFEAEHWLAAAAQHAANMGYALSKAHAAIAGQGCASGPAKREVDEQGGAEQ